MTSTHGGSRPGSGRKPDPNSKIPVTKKLDRELVDFLQTRPNATETIESALRKSTEFKAWKRENREKHGENRQK
jgi:hypothetical protein